MNEDARQRASLPLGPLTSAHTKIAFAPIHSQGTTRTQALVWSTNQISTNPTFLETENPDFGALSYLLALTCFNSRPQHLPESGFLLIWIRDRNSEQDKVERA